MITSKKNALNTSIVCAGLFFATINTFITPGYTEVNRRIQQTNKLYDFLPENQLAQRLAQLNRAIEQNPRDAFAYIKRGYLKQFNLNDALGALADYNQAILLYKGSAKELNRKYAYHNRALLKQLNLKDVSGALADYNKAIELDPKYTEAYVGRATLKQLNLKDVSGALADYNKAIELDPKHAQAYAGRGSLKMEKITDKTGAIQDFRQAARIFQAQKNTSALQQTIDKLRELGAIE